VALGTWHVTLIFGHRGASAYAPENTLAAFRRALQLGADGFELDVTLSADGAPVVIHDDTLERTTDGCGPVAKQTLKQLKQLEAGYPRKFGAAFAGERIPTLDEVFAAFGQQAIINVELKQDSSPGRQLAQRVVELIHAHHSRARVILSSFYEDNLRRVQQLDATLPLGLLYSPDEPGRVLRAWLNPEVRVEFHHPHYRLMNALTLRWIRKQGYRVNVWTVNAESDLLRLMRLSVDGLITDCPDVGVRLRQSLTN
jgi:glycerophosphoryl diester phosphodiesterase